MHIIILNNKCKVIALDNDTVVKQYHTLDARKRVLKDVESLSYLTQKFGNIYKNGWLIRTVKLLSISDDGKSIKMEHLKGKPVAELPTPAVIEAEYLYGVWVGHYQKRMMDEDGRGKLYTDLSLYNALVDTQKKSFIVIDPGGQFGRIGSIYEDIILHFYSLFVWCFKKYQNPFQYIKSFIKGYSSVSDKKLSIISYYSSFFRQNYLIGRSLSSKPKHFFLFIFGTIFLLPIYLFYIPIELIWSR
jgi:hypothetical protein